MSGLPVYYGIQNSDDTTLNVYFLPQAIKSYAEVKIKDVVDHFPMKKDGKFYHFRFNAYCDTDQKTWVDITNMNAKAPVIDNKIYVKVLEVRKSSYTKVFRSYYTKHSVEEHEKPSQTASFQHSQQQQQQQQPQAQIKKPPPQVVKINSEGTRHVKIQKPIVHEDLLGGGDTSQAQTNGISSTSKTTAGTSFFANMGNPPQQSQQTKQTQQNEQNEQKEPKFDDPIYTMSREQMTREKAKRMADAIDEKLQGARDQWNAEQEAQKGREKAYSEVEEQIRKWAGKDNQRNNIRTLLCTVHSIMWEGCNWNSLSLSDLMTNGQIKKNYFKAATIFHPDKNRHGDYKQQYISERITNELNAAWDEFRKTNP